VHLTIAVCLLRESSLCATSNSDTGYCGHGDKAKATNSLRQRKDGPRSGRQGASQKEALAMRIGLQTLVDDVMRDEPSTIRVFLDFKMRCVGCPIACFHTVDDACREHGVDRDHFLAAVRSAPSAV
jgi:hybrid cluster-associated redox disulfide protein